MKRAFNIIFWIIVSIILFIRFGASSGNYVYAFYFLIFFIPVTILTSWYFNSILLTKYLLKGDVRKFFLFTVYAFIISLDIEMILVFVAFLLMSKYDYENMGAIIDHYKWMPIVMYFVVISTGLVNMVQQYLSMKKRLEQPASVRHISVRSERKTRLIDVDTILFIESMSDYILIYLDNGDTVSTRDKISSMELKLAKGFTRIHRSYIVNDSKIDSFSKEELRIGEKDLPISRTYKNDVLRKLMILKTKGI